MIVKRVIRDEILGEPFANKVRFDNACAVSPITLYLPQPYFRRRYEVLQLSGFPITLDTNSDDSVIYWKGKQRAIVMTGGEENIGTFVRLIAHESGWLLDATLPNSNSLTLKD